jgi:hypothetical protein
MEYVASEVTNGMTAGLLSRRSFSTNGSVREVNHSSARGVKTSLIQIETPNTAALELAVQGYIHLLREAGPMSVTVLFSFCATLGY